MRRDIGFDMVSWGKAFRKGLTIFLWSLVWIIVSSIIILLGAGGLAASTFFGSTSPFEARPASNPGGFVFSLIVLIVGLIIGAIGTYATIVKVIVETALEEAKKQKVHQ